MSFDKAYELTRKHEGGYVNDPDDLGGETYKGISRKYHPSWPGWGIIDASKSNPDFPQNLAEVPGLQEMVKNFFKAQFWDLFWGDDVSGLEPDIAYELFDTAVNLGVSRAVAFLQLSLNVFNRNELLYPDLVIDGVFGRMTFEALAAYLKKDYLSHLITAMNVLQGHHYIEFMTRSSIQEKFARGWFDRVEIFKCGDDPQRGMHEG